MFSTKRVFALVLVLLMVVCACLCGCGKDEKDKDRDSQKETERVLKAEDPQEPTEIVERLSEDDEYVSTECMRIAEEFVDALYVDPNAEDIVDMMHPEYIAHYARDKVTSAADVEEWKVYSVHLQMELKNVNNNMVNNNEKFRVFWKDMVVEKATADELEEIQKNYEECELSVTDYNIVSGKLIIEFANGSQSKLFNEENTVPLVLIDGEWYLDPSTLKEFEDEMFY